MDSSDPTDYAMPPKDHTKVTRIPAKPETLTLRREPPERLELFEFEWFENESRAATDDS